MCVCAHVYVFVCALCVLHVYAQICIHIHVFVCARVYVCLHVHYVCSHVYAQMCIHIHVFVCAHVYVCLHVHKCVHAQVCVARVSSSCAVHQHVLSPHSHILQIDSVQLTSVSHGNIYLEKLLLTILYVHVPIAATSCQRSAECDVS
jgi:hypothetical protein